MAEPQVSIGRVKRDISDLVNRVAYRGERIIVTSRGKPKAVLISVEDYARLQAQHSDDDALRWRAWLAACRQLSAEILERRQGEYVDVDALWTAARADHEARDEQTTGH